MWCGACGIFNKDPTKLYSTHAAKLLTARCAVGLGIVTDF